MYRTDFWTLWEKARVGCFEGTACILSIVKQITSPGWMHETSARAWCTGKTQGNRVEREVGGVSGWGTHVTPWLIHVNVWQNPLKCCEVISLQLIKINEKKRGDRWWRGWGGCWGHYVSWNKPDTERQMRYDLTSLWKLKKLFSETECRLMVISGWGGVGRNGAISDKGDQLLVSRWVSSGGESNV